MNLLIIPAILVVIAVPAAFGHGVGFELLDPVPLGDRQVALEVLSSQYENPDNPAREIKFALQYHDTGITVRDVTYDIVAYKGDVRLFDGIFRAPDGIFVLVLKGSSSDDVTLEKVDETDFFSSLLGQNEEAVHASGSPFNTGGLYNFDVAILTAESFSKEPKDPIEYKVGLSIPHRTNHTISDPDWGDVEVSLVTYYDEIDGFGYDSAKKAVSFYMPFDWSADNINETSVVHEEFTFPKAFGGLLHAEYAASVNGYDVPARTITIDGFSDHRTVIHLVLAREDIFKLLEMHDSKPSGMNFEMRVQENSSQGTTTSNGEFLVRADSEPQNLRAGQDGIIYFTISEAFLRNTPVSVPYEVTVTGGGAVLYESAGRSLGSERDEFAVHIPQDTEKIVVKFSNLAGNQLARAEIPMIVDKEDVVIPNWVRGNAGLWADGAIDDRTFATGIGYLVSQDIIRVPAQEGRSDGNAVIPDWMRGNAGLWADGAIDDRTFATGLQFLIGNGIISIVY